MRKRMKIRKPQFGASIGVKDMYSCNLSSQGAALC